MPSGGPARTQTRRGRDWVACEKVHGAQLVIAVRDGVVQFGKRKSWLADGDDFFGWQLLRAELTAGAIAVSELVGGAGSVVYLYGELCGGGYPHDAVPAVAGLTPVQTGVWYGPDLYWMPFDIMIHSAGGEEFVSYDELVRSAGAIGWRTPPLVGRGSYAEVSGLSNRRPTAVPALFGLPTIAGNVAEGLVIKEASRMTPGERIEFKSKIAEFDEIRFDESSPWNSAQRLSVGELGEWAVRMVNPVRLASAMSKVGTGDSEALKDEVALDICVDLAEVFPVAYAELSPAAEDNLQALIRGAVAELGG